MPRYKIAWNRSSRNLPQAHILFGNNSKENDLRGSLIRFVPRRSDPPSGWHRGRWGFTEGRPGGFCVLLDRSVRK
jgi:hypothetical protein